MRLGVNIDHVATLRQARYPAGPGAPFAEPSPVDAALEALAGGAHGITAHLREDRRHIQDRDIAELREQVPLPLNFEMGNAPEIVAIALRTKPASACLVPEKRAEVTTEGGLAVRAGRAGLAETVKALQGEGVRVSMFIDPLPEEIEASAELGAEMVELHTGSYANAVAEAERAEHAGRLAQGAELAHRAGLQVNAGHGLTTRNLPGLAGVPHLEELNIGHHLIARSVAIGLRAAVAEMLEAMAVTWCGEE